MSKGRRIALGIGIFFAALLLAVVIVVPMLIDVDRYRPQVAARLESETGKPVEIGHLSLAVIPSVSIRVDDFALGNPPGFPKGDFVRAKRTEVVVDGMALLRRQVLIKSLEIDSPKIELLSDARGKWNFENPPLSRRESPRKTQAEGAPLFTLGMISKVILSQAQVVVANVLASGRVENTYFQGDGISTELEQVDLNAFTASTSSSFSTPSAVAGFEARESLWPSFAVHAAAPAAQPAAQGTLKADSLRFGTLRVTSVSSKMRLFPKQIFMDNLSLDLYGGLATGSLACDLAGKDPRYSASARLSGVDVARLLDAFPEARGKMTGKMEGAVKLSGKAIRTSDLLAGMEGAGHATIQNGQLPSLQLNKNLMLLARFSNLGPASGDPSSFSSISADFHILNEKITSDKITLVGNGVDVDGSGIVDLAGRGDLNCQGVAKLAAGQNPVGGILAGLSGATTDMDGKLSIPFAIGGTLANPRFVLKSSGAFSQSGMGGISGGALGKNGKGATQQGQTPQDIIQGIGGLFKKKQPRQLR